MVNNSLQITMGYTNPTMSEVFSQVLHSLTLVLLLFGEKNK